MRAGSFRVCIGLAALCASIAAHADYKDSYALGLKAFNDGDFAKARDMMQKALAEHPEPAARVRLYGQRFEAYLPQYYLGQAAFKLGDCATAAAQWNVPASRQLVAQFPELDSAQQSGLSACAGKLTAKTEDKPKPAPVPAPAPEKVAVAQNPPAKPEVITPAAPPPVAQKPVDAAPQPAEAAVQPAPAPTKRADVAVAKPPPPPVAAPPVAKPAPVPSGPPPPLQEAFDNYLAGRYAKVARFNAEGVTDTRARYHAFLVRSAARFTLAQIGSDESELDGARADARAAHALDNRATPDSALFSPRFRTFFQQSR